MSNRPNILLITSDQQHFSTLGFLNPKIQTPSLDRLAARGTNFTRGYCPNPTCTPTRGSILTGQYPSVHGGWTLGTKVPEDSPTVGAVLHDAGYRTSLIGKAHFQPLDSGPGCTSIEKQPTLRDLDFWRRFNSDHTPWYGFDHVETARMHGDESHVGQHYALWLEEKGLANWAQYFQPLPGRPQSDSPHALEPIQGPGYGWRGFQPWPLPEELHYSVWTADRTIAQIEQAAEEGRPFFSWSSFHDPHPPYVAPAPWATMYDPEDMEVGEYVPGEFEAMPPPHRLTREERPDYDPYRDGWAHGYHSHLHDRRTLQQGMAVYYGMTSLMDREIGRILDALDRTGQAENTLVVFTTDHGHFLGQHGLVSKGPFHYEDVVRLPFIAKYPGRIPPGDTNRSMVSLVDLAPTFLEFAGLDVPRWMQGVSQAGCWAGDKGPARDHVIVENHHTQRLCHLRTYIDERYKLTVYRGQTYGELFDLEEDPHETHNLWDKPDAAMLKGELMERFVQAELERAPAVGPRVAGA